MDMEGREGVFQWKGAQIGTWKAGTAETRLVDEVKDVSYKRRFVKVRP